MSLPQRSSPPPPHTHALPFESLPWNEFEALVLELAFLDPDVEDCDPHGQHGQRQEGVDVYARLKSGRYRCWQAKNRGYLCAADIVASVDAFLSGSWPKPAESFQICTRAELNSIGIQKEIRRQSARLARRGVKFSAIGGLKLTRMLGKHPAIIARFFSPEWARHILGTQAFEALETSLGRADLQSIESKLAAVYDGRFRALDPGLPTARSATRDIRSRFVSPDVDMMSPFAEQAIHFSTAASRTRERLEATSDDDLFMAHALGDGRDSDDSRDAAGRMHVEDWLSHSRQLLLLGGPGFGKSTVLRCLALDLLTLPVSFPRLAARYRRYIPILIPFALWVRASARKDYEVGLKEVAVQAYGSLIEPKDLERLIDHGLRERTLWILVDGVDEYSDAQAARTTLLTIETLARSHELPVLFTGRPAGVQKLSALGVDWHVARLHELSPAQQQETARRLLAEVPTEGRALDAEAIADQFFAELHRIDRLQPMAGVPLLLGGLLSVFLREHAIPRNQFALFERLIELLTGDHAERRATARSSICSGSSVFADQPVLRRNAVAMLAYVMHEPVVDPDTSREKARDLLADFLADPHGPAWPPERALAGAQELMSLDSSTSGLFVERGGGNIGFRHAAFQEHLVGVHLAQMPHKLQRELMATLASGARWRLPLLTLIQSVNPADAEKLLEWSQLLPNPGSVTRRLLMTEAALSFAHHDSAVQVQLIHDALDRIESGPFEHERLQLLDLVLDGPRDGAIGRAITERLNRWWPCVVSQPAALYDALSKWRPHATLRRTLLIGLSNGDWDSRFAAASALAALFKQDKTLPAELLEHLDEPSCGETIAATFRALTLGWPRMKGMAALVREAMESNDRIVRAIGALAAYKNGLRTHAVRDALANALECESERIDDEVMKALLTSWKKSRAVHDKCWEKIKNFSGRHAGQSYAQEILVRCRAYDERVVPWIASSFQRYRDPLLAFSFPLELLRPIFKAHPKVRAAAERSLRSGVNQQNNLRLAAVLRTPTAKTLLLREIAKNPTSQTAVNGLLDGWGMTDATVRAALQAAAAGPPRVIQHFATELPRIIRDRKLCKERLLAIASLRAIEQPGAVLEAFHALGCRADNTEVVSAMWHHVANDPESCAEALIKWFHRDRRVRALALDQLDAAACPIGVIAIKYRHDAEIREKVLARATPLPEYLRRAIASHAMRRPGDAVLKNGLARFRSECDIEASSIATVAHCRARSADGADTAALESEFAAQIRANRRIRTNLPALCGLMSLGRWDALKNASTRARERDKRSPLAAALWSSNMPTALSLIAEHWAWFDETFGSQAQHVLCPSLLAPRQFWARFAPHATRSPAMLDFFLRHCEQDALLPAASLRMLAGIRPGSDLLLEACCRTLDHTSPPRADVWAEVEQAVAQAAAARILGLEFPKSDRALEALLTARVWKAARAEHAAIPIIGLAAGWPDHPVMVRQRELLQTDESIGHFNLGAMLALASTSPDLAVFGSHLLAFVTCGIIASGWTFAGVGLDAIRRRLARDDPARALLHRALSVEQNPHIRASFPQLLATSRPLDQSERDCFGALAFEEFSRPGVPRFGLDVTVNQLRPVRRCLLEALGTMYE